MHTLIFLPPSPPKENIGPGSKEKISKINVIISRNNQNLLLEINYLKHQKY